MHQYNNVGLHPLKFDMSIYLILVSYTAEFGQLQLASESLVVVRCCNLTNNLLSCNLHVVAGDPASNKPRCLFDGLSVAPSPNPKNGRGIPFRISRPATSRAHM